MSATAMHPAATAIPELNHWIAGVPTPGTSKRFSDVYHRPPAAFNHAFLLPPRLR